MWLPLALQAAGVMLRLQTPASVAFGESVPIAVSLENRSSSPVQTVSFEDAKMEFTIERCCQPNGERSTRRAATGGTVRAIQDRTGLLRWVDHPPKMVTLEPGQSIHTEYTASELIGHFLHEGTYRMTVTYDATLSAEAETRVDFEAERDMPKLIAMLRSENGSVRWIAHGYLRSLTSDTLLKNFGGSSKSEYARAARTAERWWSDNRARLIFKGGLLVPKETN